MNKVVTVGEIGINANGNINLAKKLINLCSTFGIDYVKFQKRTINNCYSKDDLDKYRESPWGTTNREQKEGLEFSKEDYDEIDNYCKLLNIKWFVSVWDLPSIDFIKQYDLPFIKIPSALMSHNELLKEVKKTNIPVIISTGMCEKEEIDNVINILGNNIKYILHTTSSYPTPENEMNLSKIVTLKNEYGEKFKIGFSNHHQGTYFCTVAPLLGAEMIEFHITLDRSMYGSDQAASIEPNGIRIIKDHINSLTNAIGDGEWRIEKSEVDIAKKLKRSNDF